LFRELGYGNCRKATRSFFCRSRSKSRVQTGFTDYLNNIVTTYFRPDDVLSKQSSNNEFYFREVSADRKYGKHDEHFGCITTDENDKNLFSAKISQIKSG